MKKELVVRLFAHTDLAMLSVELLKDQDVLRGDAAWKLLAGDERDMSEVRQGGRRVAEVLEVLLLLLLLGAGHTRHRRLAGLVAVTGADATFVTVAFESTSIIISSSPIINNACHKKWGFTDNELCDCGEIQTMSHIVNSCPLTKFDGGLLRLHEADEAAVDWLTTYGS